jgi:hypothetical protein
MASLNNRGMTGLGGEEETCTARARCVAVGVSALRQQDTQVGVQAALRAQLYQSLLSCTTKDMNKRRFLQDRTLT